MQVSTHQSETTNYMDAIELVRKVAEQKRRRAAATEAIAKARTNVRARQRFVPERISPVRPVEMRF